MTKLRRAARVDANQDQVIAALRAAGADVLVIGQPVDLLVGRAGKTFLIEVKDPNSRYGKRGANDNQREFIRSWRGGPVIVVNGPESAIQALEGKR